MSDKPTELPAWATNDTAAEVTEPGTTLKQTGAVKNTQTGAQHINWILHRIYLWIVWFNVGIFQRSSLTDNSPIFQTADRDGRPRHYLDPNGYWMGCAIQETYRWGPINSGVFVVTGAVVDPRMTCVIDTNTTALIVSGSAGAVVSGDPQIELTVQNAATTERVIVFPTAGGSPSSPSGDCPISDLENQIAVMEWRASFDAVPASGCVQGGGFCELTDDANPDNMTANSGALITTEGAAGTQFRYLLGNNVSQTAGDTGVECAANTMYTFRIEHHGANTPVGVGNTTAAVVRFFIDGVLVHEETGANVMTAGNVAPIVFATAASAGPIADRVMSVCTVKCAWTGALDFSVPA